MEANKFVVSVSSAKSHSACNRQYYINYVLKIRKPDTPATAIGTIFAELTEYLTNNDEVKASKILNDENNTTVKFLYERNKEFLDNLKKEGGKAEFELSFGIDLYRKYMGWIDRVLETEDCITVRDYKTAKDWTYTLTEKTMGADEQLNIYGYFIQRFYNPKNKPIWLEHQQFHKGTGMRKEVRVPYNHEEGKAIYDWLVEESEKMVATKKLKVAEVPKNFDSCKAFGGCPYVNYCKGQINLEELRDVLNPNIKERTKDQLIEMKPEERLEEVKKEKAFNEKGNELLNKINKGADNMGLSIKEKLLALKAKQEEAKKQSELPDIPKADEVVPGKEEPVKNVGTVTVSVKTEAEPVPVPENPLKRKRRTKAELEAEVAKKLQDDVKFVQKVMDNEVRGLPLDANVIDKDGKEIRTGEQIIDFVPTERTLRLVEEDIISCNQIQKAELSNALKRLIKLESHDLKVAVTTKRALAKQVLVLVGCSFLEEDKNNPSDFLHEKYVKPILEQEKIPHISCSEFSKANKSLMLFAQSILDDIYNKYESINIDIRRPVDALVYTMILDLDTRKEGKRFKLIRSTF